MDIRVKSITKSFGRQVVLQDVSFSVKAGTCTGILGANGSGKSTLFSILAGVQRGQGTFLVDDMDLTQNHGLRTQLVGYIPQGTPLLEELTAYDNLRLWYSRQELDALLKTDSLLRWFGVHEFLRTPVHKMSGGMRKRLSIVCAVAHDPSVLLMDEPTAALDLVCKQRIHEYIHRCKLENKAVILATHEERELALCEQILLLKEGRLEPIAYTGQVAELVERLQ